MQWQDDCRYVHPPPWRAAIMEWEYWFSSTERYGKVELLLPNVRTDLNLMTPDYEHVAMHSMDAEDVHPQLAHLKKVEHPIAVNANA